MSNKHGPWDPQPPKSTAAFEARDRIFRAVLAILRTSRLGGREMAWTSNAGTAFGLRLDPCRGATSCDLTWGEVMG